MFAFFHARGTLACVNDLLNKLVIGVSSCTQQRAYLDQSCVNI